MKNPGLLLLLLIFTLFSCKTQKIAPKPQPVAQEKAVPASQSATPKATKPAPISSKEERFSAAQGETADFGANKFFIILGSFSVLENAQRLKATLASEGFQPAILMNENGMYRVCGNSYALENEARARISEVRGKFSNYNDIWLLIKKQ